MSTAKIIIRNYRGNISKKGKTPIFLQYCHHRKTILLGTGESIEPEFWDSKRQEARKALRGFTSLNDYLHSLKEKLDNIIRQAHLLGSVPTVQYVKEKFSIKTEPTPNTGLIEYFQLYLEECKNFKQLSSIRGNQTTLMHLQGFEKYRSTKLTFDSINMNFYTAFRKYLGERNNGKSSFGKHIRTIKTVMNSAYDRKLHTNLDYKQKGFKVTEDEADTIYLNEAELQRLHEVDLTGRPGLERVRDVFYAACWLGIRWSDYDQITPNNIKDGYLHILTQKTNQRVIVPLHPNVLEILRKYNYSLPTGISNQKMNAHLKELGKLCKFDQIVVKRVNKGMTRVKVEFKKWELLTSHCARRSFCTNLFLQGFSPINLRLISGHKTEAAFLRYIRVSEEQAAGLLQKHWQAHFPHLRVA